MSSFAEYSAYYDLLYRDKDYGAEAAYVADKIRSYCPDAHSLLEFGSGTGRHGRLLAGIGFDVHGVERSSQMVAVAHAHDTGPPADRARGTFTCDVGDICTVDLGRSFDAVIALFHVISYQTTDEALRNVFEAAARHLRPNGVFLFDVWHGPAILAQRPSERVKEVADGRYAMTRNAHPEMDEEAKTVKVTYDMKCHDRVTGQTHAFSEEHLMRYIFPAEVESLARGLGMRLLACEEFLTGAPPSASTWGVAYVLQR